MALPSRPGNCCVLTQTALPLPLDAELMYQYDDAMDDRKSKLRRVLMEADRLRYLYDFGDSWQHVIAVESIEPCDFTGTWCEALDGARACPPEDVGACRVT